jgi:Putative auto-transporter adhesin, head GIN domain
MRFLALLATGCIFLDVQVGSGDLVTEEREVAQFSVVDNSTQIDVSVEIDPQATGTVTVTCDDNLMSAIRTESTGDTLRITVAFGTQIRPSGACAAVVHTPLLTGLAGSGSGNTEASGDLFDLSFVEGSGSGRVTASGAVANLSDVRSSGSGGVEVTGIEASGEVDADASGSGGIVLAGTAPSAALSSSGSGGIDARDLTVEDGTVDISGSGDVWLTATGLVTADLSGSGSLHLFGGAAVDEDSSGSGGVIVED